MRHGPRSRFRIDTAANGDSRLYEFGRPGWILVDTFASPRALTRYIRWRSGPRTDACAGRPA
jgi:hypothetical protein